MASFKGVANNEISEELKESAKLLCEVFISNEMTVLPCDLKYSGKILSIHPFFGPESFKDPSRRKIALITDICPVGSEFTVKKLFPDCSVIKMYSDEHDRMMASEQGLPYLISLYFRESGRSITPFTGSGRILKEIIQLSEKESIDVMKDSIAENLKIKVLLSEMYEFFRQISSSQ